MFLEHSEAKVAPGMPSPGFDKHGVAPFEPICRCVSTALLSGVSRASAAPPQIVPVVWEVISHHDNNFIFLFQQPLL